MVLDEPNSSICLPSLLTPALVLQNMMLLPHFSVIYADRSALPLDSTFQNICCILSMLTSSGPIPIIAGSCWYESTISSTSSSNVALKRIVCRFGLHSSSIEHTGSMKPISAILSASSRTTISTSSRRKAPLSRRSINLPGQATNISTPLSNFLNCPRYGVPPYTDSMSRPAERASGWRTLRICSASSLVGVRISDVGLFDSALAVLDIIGNPNARVFPEPVGALQQISLPSIASGIASHCTSKGSVKPSFSRATTKPGSIPKSENRTKIFLCLARNPILFSMGVGKNA